MLSLHYSDSEQEEPSDLAVEFAQDQALQVCGLAWTNANEAARVNAFGPMAFCKSVGILQCASIDDCRWALPTQAEPSRRNYTAPSQLQPSNWLASRRHHQRPAHELGNNTVGSW